MMLTKSHWHADTSEPLLSSTVGDVIFDRAATHPDRTALIAEGHDGITKYLSYSALLDEAVRSAGTLLQLADPGDRVALFAPNLLEWPVIEYGAMLSGIILVAVNPGLQVPELTYMLEHSRTSVLLHAAGMQEETVAKVLEAGRAPELRHVLGLSEWTSRVALQPTDLPLPSVDPTAAAMLQYTSGTTGNPKGVLLSQRSMLNNARFAMEVTEVQQGAVCLSPMPMFHTAGCITCTLGPLWVGGTEVLAPRPRSRELLDLATREKATVLFHTPAILRNMLDVATAERLPIPQIDTIMGGAASISPDLVHEAEQAFNGRVLNLYGQTELASIATVVRPGQSDFDKINTVGRPLPHLDLAVVDPGSDQTLPIGVTGEILARGYQSFLGYLDDPEATAATKTIDGWVRTGDLGSMDQMGTLTITGRLKELIIRGGENIAPAEIEIALQRHEAVLGAVVVGVKDRRLGEIVAAVMRVADGREQGLVDELRAQLATTLARHKIPQQWYITNELPATSTGKIQRFKLRAAIAAGELVQLEDSDHRSSIT